MTVSGGMRALAPGGGGTEGKGDDVKAYGLPQNNGWSWGILEGLAFYKNQSFISAEATMVLHARGDGQAGRECHS